MDAESGSPRRTRLSTVLCDLKLKKQYPGHDIEQFNIILDVLGGRSRDLDLTMRELFGSRSCGVLRRMQKATISSSLNIVRTFKATVT